MDFFKLIKSLDELLYEVMSWLLFYPLTLWRTIVHPVATLHYAENEMKKPDEERFDDALNPPLFLFLTLILAHLVELSMVGQSSVVTGRTGLQGFIRDDTTLVILRIIIFALVPLLLARRKLKARGAAVKRDTLRQPFYAQCYATTPFALIISAGGIVSRLGYPFVSVPVLLGAFLWLGVVEVEYFRTRLEVSRLEAFRQASIAMGQAFAVVILTGAALD